MYRNAGVDRYGCAKFRRACCCPAFPCKGGEVRDVRRCCGARFREDSPKSPCLVSELIKLYAFILIKARQAGSKKGDCIPCDPLRRMEAFSPAKTELPKASRARSGNGGLNSLHPWRQSIPGAAPFWPNQMTMLSRQNRIPSTTTIFPARDRLQVVYIITFLYFDINKSLDSANVLAAFLEK